MSLELFNKTNMTKELPKYNYEGKFKLPPLGIYPIQDYMISFYKPFNKIGVIIRASADTEVIEEEVKNVFKEKEEEVQKAVESLTESPNVENEIDSLVDSLSGTLEDDTPDLKKEDSESELSDNNTVEETQTSKPEVKVYTEAELQELKLAELKDISEKLGLKVEGKLNEKKTFIEAILTSQK